MHVGLSHRRGEKRKRRTDGGRATGKKKKQTLFSNIALIEVQLNDLPSGLTAGSRQGHDILRTMRLDYVYSDQATVRS
jgi:hypothetical protein